MPRNGPLRLTLVATIATISGCTSSGSATTTRTRSTSMATQASPSNEEIVRSVYEVSLNTGDMGLLDRVVAPDFVGPRGGRGPSAFARTLLELRAAFPDIHFDLEYIVIGPQGVCEEARVTGTHRAGWLENEPTGERLEWRNAIFFPWDPQAKKFKGEMVYTDLAFPGA